jgi:hypothetical protein
LFVSHQNCLSTIEYNPNTYVIQDLSHSLGTALKNCLGAFLNKGRIWNLITSGTLHSKDSKWIRLSKVNGTAVPKGG